MYFSSWQENVVLYIYIYVFYIQYILSNSCNFQLSLGKNIHNTTIYIYFTCTVFPLVTNYFPLCILIACNYLFFLHNIVMFFRFEWELWVVGERECNVTIWGTIRQVITSSTQHVEQHPPLSNNAIASIYNHSVQTIVNAMPCKYPIICLFKSVQLLDMKILSTSKK